MSRGAGRIERAIRSLFDAHPHEAFTTDDLCLACYEPPITRSHSVAVLRAAQNVVATDPDWRCLPSPMRRNCVVFCNMASLPSVIMRGELLSPYRPARDAVRAILDAPPGSWHAECREKARQRVSDHVALRDADPAERTRLKAAQAARNAENLSRLGQGIRQVLSKGTGGASTTLTALAGRVRGAAAQNDPDVQRSELANIAEALEALGSHMTQSVRLPTSETVADDPAGGRDTACAALPEPAMDIVR